MHPGLRWRGREPFAKMLVRAPCKNAEGKNADTMMFYAAQKPCALRQRAFARKKVPWHVSAGLHSVKSRHVNFMYRQKNKGWSRPSMCSTYSILLPEFSLLLPPFARNKGMIGMPKELRFPICLHRRQPIQTSAHFRFGLRFSLPCNAGAFRSPASCCKSPLKETANTRVPRNAYWTPLIAWRWPEKTTARLIATRTIVIEL